MLALKIGKTIIDKEFLVPGSSALSSLLVIKVRDGGSVDGGVDEDRGDGLVASSRDSS